MWSQIYLCEWQTCIDTDRKISYQKIYYTCCGQNHTLGKNKKELKFGSTRASRNVEVQKVYVINLFCSFYFLRALDFFFNNKTKLQKSTMRIRIEYHDRKIFCIIIDRKCIQYYFRSDNNTNDEFDSFWFLFRRIQCYGLA